MKYTILYVNLNNKIFKMWLNNAEYTHFFQVKISILNKLPAFPKKSFHFFYSHPQTHSHILNTPYYIHQMLS